MTTERDLIQQLAGLARRKHYTCEDSWYSCPQSECGSANDNAGAECDCGADEHNAKVDAICAALSLPEPEWPTDEELHDLWLELYGFHPDGPTSGDVAVIARAVLARWGRPAVEPETNGQT